jgi:glycosyltransferase involved in cell wall biosynthesis
MADLLPVKITLSIVMPVYNAERYIKQALENIASQTFHDYELLLLDGMSTDSTIAIIQSKQASDPRIRLLSQKDKGIYDAMNKGTALVRGEWVYFMGCDDAFYDSDVLEKVSLHLTEDVDLAYGDTLWVPDGEKEEGAWEPRRLVDRNINHQRIFYRKQLFAQWGNYDLQYKVASDHELNIRFFCNYQIRKQYIPITIARYYSGGFSAHKLDEVFLKNWKIIFHQNFAAHLPIKEMYTKLGWYCRYQLDQKKYGKSFNLFCDVFFHTLSAGFVLLTWRHFIQSFRKHAS